MKRFLEGKDDDLVKELTRQMEAAAAETRFEQAAVMRDRIQALNTVRERQRIISTEETDQDIIGLVRQGSEACVQLFFVRKGRLLGRESFFFDRVGAESDGEILSAFVRQFYARTVVPASELLVSTEIAESDLVLEWLRQRRDGRVEIVAPQRGRRRELVAMVEENAALALQSHLLSQTNRHQAVREELQRALGLAEPPDRIECFDISTIQGSDTVASMVVWQGGDMKKDEYKRYKIRTVIGTDDFASMQEVLTRRYAKALEAEGPLPDLILLDGGRGQLNVGVKVLEDLGLDYLPIASLAKRAEEVYTPERLAPLVLDLGSPALMALQKIRDEAHRFAITYHKKVRQRRTISSELDRIAGVGPRVRTSLLKTLGSARGVRAATVAELAAVPTVTPKLAQRIYDHFHPPADGRGTARAGGGLAVANAVERGGDPHAEDAPDRDGRRRCRDRPGPGVSVPAPDQAGPGRHRRQDRRRLDEGE